MLLNPGVMALVLGAAVSLVFVLGGCWVGVGILCGWDFASPTARQLALERRTYLVSTLLNYALGFTVASTFLFLYTADHLHQFIVGAMCATGSLNANAYGWDALAVKVLLLFGAGAWIALNRVDQAAEDYPLVRLKYGALLVLAPLVAADLALQLLYFGGIRPNVISSCCGALFTQAGPALASTLATVPALPALWTLFGVAGAQLVCGARALAGGGGASRCVLAALSAVLLPVAVAAVVSAVSLYIYELPAHPCPLDILQAEYGYVGYPLYVSLASGSFFGVLVGLFEPLRSGTSVGATVARAQRRWTLWSLLASGFLMLLVAWAVLSSGLELGG